jgi:Na+/H+ antiporter NhaD/arsenite permease-like protein
MARAAQATVGNTDFTGTYWGWLALGVFVVAYGLVVSEEFTNLRKSKPVVAAAGLLWVIVALAWRSQAQPGLSQVVRHSLLEYSELLLFLIAAMTYVNTLEERNVFGALRAWLLERRFSLRTLFWLTGAMAFVLSPLIDNLTTALVLGTVVVSVGQGRAGFIVPACVNVVVAANAGGAFSPFGDITTLMVWQKGLLSIPDFFHLLIPSLVNWLVPAVFMSLAVPRDAPLSANEMIKVKYRGYVVIILFAITVALTVVLQQLLDLPAFLGMMTGLGLLQVLGYFIRRRERQLQSAGGADREPVFDVFSSIQRVEWDTLLFFYGVMLCVSALGALGYLALLSRVSYGTLGASGSNILVGLLSALVDNIPIMFAVLTMNPDMSEGQWLLVTLTAGVGGSLLSIGSAAGVALMGQGGGIYTFVSHLKWSWAIGLGYAAAIWAHFWINAGMFEKASETWVGAFG